MDKATFCYYHRSICRGKLGCFIEMLLLLKNFICIIQVLIKIKNYRNNLVNYNMDKWSDAWYEKLDQNGIRFGKWVEKKSSTHALCKLCNRELKFDQRGIQALKQHSGKPRHVEVSEVAFSNTVRRFETSTSSSSTSLFSQKKVFNASSLLEKVTAAEAMWPLKTAEDMSLRNCDNVPSLFQCMFSDSEIVKTFTIGRNKAFYVFQDGLGLWLCQCFQFRWSV